MGPRENECKIKTGYYLSFKTENLTVTKMKDSICLFIKQFEGHIFVIVNIFSIEEYSIIKSMSCHLRNPTLLMIVAFELSQISYKQVDLFNKFI